MKNFKNLFAILSTLSTSELTGFSKFLKSPYFNNSRDIIEFFEYIKRFHPKYTSQQLLPERLYRKLYKGTEGLDKKKLSNLAYKTTDLLKRFLVVEQLGEDAIEFRRHLGRVYHSKNLPKFYLHNLEQQRNELDSKSIRDFSYYKVKNANMHDWYFNPYQSFTDEWPSAYIKKLNRSLGKEYALVKLRCAVEMLHRKLLYNNENYEEELVDLKTIIAQSKLYEDPVFDLYIRMIEFLQWEGRNIPSVLLGAYINELKTYQLLFSIEELIFLINKTMSLLYQHYLNNGDEYMELCFELYRWSDSKNLLPREGMLVKESVYLNCVLAAVLTGHFEWAWQFMETKKRRLPEAFQENAYQLGKAYYHFHQGDYEKALGCILMIPDYNMIYRNRISFLKIRCHFEMTIQEKLFMPILRKALKKFQRQLDDMDYKPRQAYENALDLISKMTDFIKKRGKMSKEEGAAAIDQLNRHFQALEESKNQGLVGKKWISKKLNQLSLE